jgi:uncharacterized protein YrrD
VNRPYALANAIRGLPVVARSEGSLVGKLDDFLLSPVGLQIIGYKLKSPGFFSAARGVASEAVEHLGRDFVIVSTESVVEGAGSSRGILEDRVWWTEWSGVRCIVRRGAEVGRLHDLVLSLDGSNVRGFLLDGNRLLVPDSHCVAGIDSLILENLAAAIKLPPALDSQEWWNAIDERLKPLCAPVEGR